MPPNEMQYGIHNITHEVLLTKIFNSNLILHLNLFLLVKIKAKYSQNFLNMLVQGLPAQPGPEASRAQRAWAARTTVSRPGGDGAAPGSSTLVGAGCTWA